MIKFLFILLFFFFVSLANIFFQYFLWLNV